VAPTRANFNNVIPRLANAYSKRHQLGYKILSARTRGANKAYINRLVERRAGINQQISNIKRSLNNRGPAVAYIVSQAALARSHARR
jgi:hypothetical protein